MAAAETAMTEAVVVVHGLWMTGAETYLLRRRLAGAGYRTYRFRYASRRSTLSEDAAQLHRFTAAIDAPVVHFVAHSMGGLVVRRLFHEFPTQRPGRIVTLGTPHCGSRVARRFARRPLGRRLLGTSLRQGLDGEVPLWRGGRELGIIAGSAPFGLGMLIAPLPRPHDGTVAVEETRLAGANDHLILPTSHLGLLLSSAVARQVLHFLREGRFLRR